MATTLLMEEELKRSQNEDGLQHVVEVSLVIPTFNERDNIGPLLERLEASLKSISWEAIFVDDDSPDKTADLLRDIARTNSKVRVIRRIGRRGLTSACVEGVLSSSALFFAVIDADMQHDETILPKMLRRLEQEDLDVVVASRYVAGGSVEGWDSRRQWISRLASKAALLVTKANLRDPMSGYFLMRREAFDEAVRELSQHGFKFLLDLFASAPRPLRFAEEPYQFGTRQHGQSKLDGMAVWEYGMLLADKLFGRIIPPRLLFFAFIGGLGLGVHLLTLGLALKAGIAFSISQAVAVIIAMTSNFTLNNFLTYRDKRLTGYRFFRGLFFFYLICSLGAAANVGVASVIYHERPVWWLAGLAGALVGVVWNYVVSGFLVWKDRYK